MSTEDDILQFAIMSGESVEQIKAANKVDKIKLDTPKTHAYNEGYQDGRSGRQPDVYKLGDGQYSSGYTQGVLERETEHHGPKTPIISGIPKAEGNDFKGGIILNQWGKFE